MTFNGIISAASDLNRPPDQSVVSTISTTPAARALGLAASGHSVFASAASAARLFKRRPQG